MERNEQQKRNKIPRLASLALLLVLVTTCLLSSTLAKYVSTLSGKDSARVAKFDFGATVSAKVAEDQTLTGATLASETAAINLFATSYTNTDSEVTVASSNKIVAPGVYGSFQLAFSGTSEVGTRLEVSIEETNAAGNGDTDIPLFYYYDGVYFLNEAASAQYGDPRVSEIAINVTNADGGTTTVEINSTNYGGGFADLADVVTDELAIHYDSGAGFIAPGTNLATVTSGSGITADTVTWYWPFEVYDESGNNISDVNDTRLGVAAATATAADVTLEIEATLTQVD